MLDLVRKVRRPLANQYHFFQSRLASQYYGYPEKKLKIIGVTGTDGKTTTTNLIFHILKTAGIKVGLISTVKAVIGEKEYDTGLHVTTPSPLRVKRYLQQMVNAQTEVAVLEVTSHALDQNRVWGVGYEYGIITNISHEHLDYHGSFQRYVNAKAKLVERSKTAILNRDDPNFLYLQMKAKGRVISFSIKEKAALSAKQIQLAPFGTRFTLKPDGLTVRTPLIGNFNVYNVLAALAVARDLGIEDKVTLKALRTFPVLPGRMERIEEGQNFTVIVDFAHTPQALQEALKTLRLLTRKKLIAVFGAASERDVDKRPIMGKIAIKEADLVVLTSEDPRNEDPNAIMTEIASGAVRAGGILNKNFWMIKDRKKAIEYAIKNLASTGDVVAVFGKGHEKSMNIQGVEMPWSDQEEVRTALKNRRRK